MYVDITDIITYKVELKDLSDWIIGRVLEIEDTLYNGLIPAGQVSGLCQFYKYQTRCYNDGNGLTAKPVSIPKE